MTQRIVEQGLQTPRYVLGGFSCATAQQLAAAGFVLQGLGTDNLVMQGFGIADPARDEAGRPSGYLVMGLGGPRLVTQGCAFEVAPYSEPVVDWLVFLPHVLPSTMGCPRQLVIDHCIKAAREFCARTRVWTVRVDAGTATAGRTDHPLRLDGADPTLLNGATVGTAQHSAEFPAVDEGTAGRHRRAGAGGRTVSLSGAGGVAVDGAEAGDSITLDLVLKPSLQAPGLPQRLEPYVDDIAHGAISSLCLLPRQEWTDAHLAGVERARFSDAIASVGHNVEGGFAAGARRRRLRSRLL